MNRVPITENNANRRTPTSVRLQLNRRVLQPKFAAAVGAWQGNEVSDSTSNTREGVGEAIATTYSDLTLSDSLWGSSVRIGATQKKISMGLAQG